jgi:hypothetical protein
MDAALPYKPIESDSQVIKATWSPKKMLLLRTGTAQTLYERYSGFRVLLPEDTDGPVILRAVR